MNTKTIGDFGEEAVSEYLIGKGYRILSRNFHSRYGELDIVANDNGCIVFVEVKTRKNSNYGNASEYVNYYKQKKIITTAKYFLKDNIDAEIRFDVCEVYYTINGENFVIDDINHIENAFICE